MKRHLTAAQVRKLHELENAVHQVETMIVSAAPRADMPFADATPAQRAQLQEARAALHTFERRMINESRAYRGSRGVLLSY